MNTSLTYKTFQAEKPTLDEHLRLAAKERQSKHETVVKADFPNIREVTERVYFGNLSWTLPERSERWIRHSALIDIGYGWQTGSEIARDYLDWKFPKKLRAVGAQAQSLRSNRFAPLFVRPETLEFASYVDIKATYWSIMQIVGWNVDYFPGHWLSGGTPPDDFPLPDNKVARNSLVSTGLSVPMRIWTGKKFITRHRPNNHINLGLWACIMDILHSIAKFALTLGACYVHTDGYILQTWDAGELMDFIAQYGLSASIKATGRAIVNGIGNYMVGEKRTKYFGEPGVLVGGLNSVMNVDGSRFQEKMQKIIARNRTLDLTTGEIT